MAIKQQFGDVKNVVTKFAFATRVGFIPNNPYKQNQDSFILAPNLLNQPALHYFGICDGHGQFGKEVSSYVKSALPSHLEEELQTPTPNVS
jgi:serine/threonine protein phosphatase PrpC